jgi:DGQHR domain-containing protein
MKYGDLKMEHKETDNLFDEINELYERDKKERRVLAQLLDRHVNQQGKYLATRGEMGIHHAANNKTFRTPSFVVSHELSWLATNIKMGSEMPFMRNYLDKQGRLQIDESNVEELKQRQPDWSRQAALTAYLATDRTRKFGTILAVISPDWVDNPQHEFWGPDRRALRSAANFEALDLAGRVGLLSLGEDVMVYALDGQHRIMGLRGIKDLLENQFRLRNRTGDEIKRLALDDFLNAYGIDVNTLQTLMSERMHVEYIPAVLPGETREEGSRRVRSVFVAINSNAKKPSKGENYLLDETDGYALAARRVGVRHSLFKGNGRSRVNWKSSALPERSEWYTTLEALKDMTQVYLKYADQTLAKAWSPPFGLKEASLRPSEESLDDAAGQANEFFDRMAKLPVFQALERSNDLPAELANYRSFPAGKEDAVGRGHLLLRPIGQIVLATAVGKVIGAEDSPMTLDDVFSVLTTLDRNGRFEAHRPANVWYGVTYNFHKNKMEVSLANRELAVRLLVYLIRGANEQERTKLLQDVIAMREVEGHWRPFSGDQVVPVVRDASGRIEITGINLPLPKQ